MLSGCYFAQKKDGSNYYRSSITYKNKHISLGSFSTEKEAHHAYLYAQKLLSSDKKLIQYRKNSILPFEKWVILINFRDHNVYFKTPIYLQKNFFHYYMSKEEILTFDIDDLFFYSEHKIQKRNGHYFVADYGMQLSLGNRYGIKSFSVKGRDYTFINGDSLDFRYENLLIINRYAGVLRQGKTAPYTYLVKIHIHGYWNVGRFADEITAAIAYNKAVDLLHLAGIQKEYAQNYIETLSARDYAEIYSNLQLPDFKYPRTK